MNRGSARRHLLLRRQEPASMRPRFMNRGSGLWRDPGIANHWSFNEAPIHESGKSTQRNGSPPSKTRFNEAPIHESGKLPGGVSVSE